MRDPHPDVLDLGQVALERVVEALLEEDKLRQLRGFSTTRGLKASGGAHLRIFLVGEGPDDVLCGLTEQGK